MDIQIPRFLVRLSDRIRLWGDKLVWRVGPLNIRRIDFPLALSGLLAVGYYGWTSGWLGALTGAVMWAFMAMVVLFFF